MSIIDGFKFKSDANLVLDALHRSLGSSSSIAGQGHRRQRNFCRALGYEAREIIGQHHRMFVAPDEARSTAYTAFWDKLGRGEYDAGEYRRIARAAATCGSRLRTIPCRRPEKGREGRQIRDRHHAKKLEARSSATRWRPSIGSGRHRIHAPGQCPHGQQEFSRRPRLQPRGNKGQASQPLRRSGLCEIGRVSRLLGETERRRIRRTGVPAHRQGRTRGLDRRVYNPIFDLNGKVSKVVKFAIDVTSRVHAVHSIGQALGKLAEATSSRGSTLPFRRISNS